MTNMNVVNKKTFSGGLSKIVSLAVLGAGCYFLGPKVLHGVKAFKIKVLIPSLSKG